MPERYCPDMSPDVREKTRSEFAYFCMAVALKSQDNAELLERLQSILPDNFLALVGTGSSRRTYSTPLGVCVKVQREHPIADPLDDAELEARGGEGYLSILTPKRRTANLLELRFATYLPKLCPRVYGFLAGGFGIFPTRPSILISESACPLDRLLPPGDLVGVSSEDICVDGEGFLQIYDQRFKVRDRPDDAKPYPHGDEEPGVWTGNLGRLANGRFCFTDRSDHGRVEEYINRFTLAPYGWGLILSPTDEQTTKFSLDLLVEYDNAYRRAGVA